MRPDSTSVHNYAVPNPKPSTGQDAAAADPASGPLAPITVERIRAQLTQPDAALVSLLAHAGLRPDEATQARWGDVRERTIHVYASKTKRARTIKLLQPLAQDLRVADGV